MLNVVTKLYSRQSADYENFVFLMGMVLSCLLFVVITDLLFYGATIRPVVYALFAWGSIRTINGTACMGKSLLSEAQAFSTAFLLYFIIIVILGYNHTSLPLKEIAYLAFADLVVFFIINFRDLIKNYLFLLGIIFALFLCTLATVEHITPWYSYLSPAGVGYIDTFRDSAVIRGWSDYNAITHGTHGLLYTPYHSLFALFHSAFLGFTEGNAFMQLQYFGLLVAPALFIYGIIKLVEIIAHDSVIRHKFWYAIAFALTYSAVGYSFSQASTTTATFVTIVCLPVIFDVWKNRGASWVSLFILAVSIPLMLYARAFHGLVLMMLSGPIILDRRPLWKGGIPFLGCLSGLAVLLLFYGEVQRNSDIYFSSVSILWTPRLLDPLLTVHLFSTPLIIIACFFVALWLKSDKNWLVRLESPYSRLVALGLIVIASVSVACLKALGYSDVLYITILMAWILFFILISEDVFPTSYAALGAYFQNTQSFFGVKFSMTCDKTKEVFRKRQKLFVKVGVLTLLMLPVISGLDTVQKDFRAFTKRAPYTALDKDAYNTCPARQYDPLCRMRSKKTGVADLPAISQSSLPAQMGRIAKDKARNLKGNTAVYIQRSHPYWNFFARREHTGLYFMAEHGIPLIYGLHRYTDPGYGYALVEHKGGLLKPVNELGGNRGLCQTAKEVAIDNIIIFSGNALENETVSCKELL